MDKLLQLPLTQYEENLLVYYLRHAAGPGKASSNESKSSGLYPSLEQQSGSGLTSYDYAVLFYLQRNQLVEGVQLYQEAVSKRRTT
jgi:hypothetical protein